MKKYLAFILTAFFLIFSGCSDFTVERDELITVTIGLGSGGISRQTGFPLDNLQMGDLEYEVVLTNMETKVVVDATVNHGPTTTATAVITAGKWKIDAVTWLTAAGAAKPGITDQAGDLYAAGTTGEVDIDASTSTIEVEMKVPTSLSAQGDVNYTISGDVNDNKLSLSGFYLSGQTLTAEYSSPNWIGKPTWMWTRNYEPIPGANTSQYTLTEADRQAVVANGGSLAIRMSLSYSGNLGFIDKDINMHREILITTWPDSLIPNGNYILASNITVTSPVPGNYIGTFDGNGNTITLNINETNRESVGLFSDIGINGTVKNLRLQGSVNATNSTGSVYAGAVAGRNQGMIRNVSSSVSVSGETSSTSIANNAYIGGIAGDSGILTGGGGSSAFIMDSYSTGSVTANSANGGASAGGIAGHMTSSSFIRFSWAEGTISSNADNGTARSGGIAGELLNAATITLENNVALNSTLTAEGSSNVVNRIATFSANPTFTNNFADRFMPAPTGSSWAQIGLGLADGAHFPDDPDDHIGNWTASTSSDPPGPGWIIPGEDNEDRPWQWELPADNRPRLWFEAGVNVP